MEFIYTRFPPEPNFYSLHFGHLKAMMVDFLKHPNCRTILRLDDTNPESEKQEYVDGIIRDVRWLEFSPYKITYTSDYFQILCDYAKDLIRAALAYVDFSDNDAIKEMKHNKIECKYRSTDVNTNLVEFQKMRNGEYKKGEAVLRLKIDMNHGNQRLRDPIAYRINFEPHYKTGKSWCIYPTYDYSHGIVDAIEKINYSYCTTEFYEHREQYFWPVIQLSKLGHDYLIPSKVHEFGKLVIENGVLSKRKIIQLVNSGTVESYDDPRLYTIASLRNRGYTPSVLKSILKEITESSIGKHDTVITEKQMQHYFKKHLGDVAYRMFAVLNPLPLTLNGAFDVDCKHPNHPKNLEMGDHTTKLTKSLFIEKLDFKDKDEKSFFGLAPDKIVRLKYHGFIKYVSHISSNVTCESIEIKDECVAKKIKGNLHWVSEEDSIECKFILYDFPTLNIVHMTGRVEKSVFKTLHVTKDSIIQFERIGYFKLATGINSDSILTFIRICEL